MNKIVLAIVCICLLGACQNDETLFEKSADERVAEAIANLKAQLTAPAEGWLLRYKPESESGAYYVLLNFDEEDNVRIRTDFGTNDGEFYDQTITYRIDNSLGLELILENYSFFSFLFELDDASFLAEYEFDYINETPEGALVFRSKTDPSSPTTLVFEPASANDVNLLGTQVDMNLTVLANDLQLLSPLYKLSYTAQDVALYFSFNDITRTISFTYASPLEGLSGGQALSFVTPYIIQGNSIILDNPLESNVLGRNISISAIQLNELLEASLNPCSEQEPIVIHRYSGAIDASPITLESTLADPAGADFANFEDEIFTVTVGGVFNNGESVGQDIANEIPGVQLMVMYYQNDPVDPFLALGYFMVNEQDNTSTIAVKEFTPTYIGNQIQFDFAPEYTVLRDTTQTLNFEAMDRYLNALTEGGTTYIVKAPESLGYYQFYNPCNGWSMVMFQN